MVQMLVAKKAGLIAQSFASFDFPKPDRHHNKDNMSKLFDVRLFVTWVAQVAELRAYTVLQSCCLFA
jgi:hypothetical protein